MGKGFSKEDGTGQRKGAGCRAGKNDMCPLLGTLDASKSWFGLVLCPAWLGQWGMSGEAREQCIGKGTGQDKAAFCGHERGFLGRGCRGQGYLGGWEPDWIFDCTRCLQCIPNPPGVISEKYTPDLPLKPLVAAHCHLPPGKVRPLVISSRPTLGHLAY